MQVFLQETYWSPPRCNAIGQTICLLIPPTEFVNNINYFVLSQGHL